MDRDNPESLLVQQFNTNTPRHVKRVAITGEPLAVVSSQRRNDYVHVVPTPLWKRLLDRFGDEARVLVEEYAREQQQPELDLRSSA